MSLKSLLHIGPEGKNEKSVKSLTGALVSVLNTPASDAAKVAAVDALKDMFVVKNVSITGNSFTNTD